MKIPESFATAFLDIASFPFNRNIGKGRATVAHSFLAVSIYRPRRDSHLRCNRDKHDQRCGVYERRRLFVGRTADTG